MFSLFTNFIFQNFSDYHDEDEAKCLLHVYIDSCHNLQSPATKYKESSKPSPFVELNIGNNVESQKTYPESFTNDPVFEKGFTFTVINPYSDDLHIRVIDSGHKDTEIGSIKIRTSGIIIYIHNMSKDMKTFQFGMKSYKFYLDFFFLVFRYNGSPKYGIQSTKFYLKRDQ